MLNVGEELLPVAVDLIDAHGGDDLAELAEDHVLGLRLEIFRGEAEEADGGVGHEFGFSANRHGENGGNVDADIFDGECALEVALDLDGVEGEPGVFLDEGEDEGGAAVDAAGGVTAADFSVDDEDAVGGAAFVASDEEDEEGEEEDSDEDDEDGPVDHRRDIDRGIGDFLCEEWKEMGVHSVVLRVFGDLLGVGRALGAMVTSTVSEPRTEVTMILVPVGREWLGVRAWSSTVRFWREMVTFPVPVFWGGMVM